MLDGLRDRLDDFDATLDESSCDAPNLFGTFRLRLARDDATDPESDFTLSLSESLSCCIFGMSSDLVARKAPLEDIRSVSCRDFSSTCICCRVSLRFVIEACSATSIGLAFSGVTFVLLVGV